MKNSKMKICVLTQTATDISDYYKSFFKDFDVFFVTFKEPNPRAIDFVPKSTWSDGRNRLWGEVRGKYDYYLFIDDDLIFYKAKYSNSTLLQRISQKINKNVPDSYKECSANSFFDKLNYWLIQYKPEVLTVKSLNNLSNHILDKNALYNNSFIRRVGWFDAQFTLFSNYAAERLLPYDTQISGWASAQILIYLLSYNVFKNKAISALDIAVNNTFHTGAYVDNYKSNLDCKNMVEHICSTTDVKYNDLFNNEQNHVNLFYGQDEILDNKISPNRIENYGDNFQKSPVSNIGNFMLKNNLKFL